MAQSAAHAAAVGTDETARLYGKYARQLYRYCLARLRSPEEAEDAVQNTFIRVHGALARGTAPRFEAAWLYKIAHNVCLTRAETRSRRAEHELTSDLDDLDVAAPESEREALIGLEAALASMPKNLRDAILLREWQGLSYAEIADSLDTSVPAVETLIFRARRHLASALQPAGAAVLDAGTLYGAVRVLLARLRGALGFLGPGKLAAGLTAAALGTAGVTAALTDFEAHPPAHDRTPAQEVRAAVPTADVAAPAAVPAAATATVAAPAPAPAPAPGSAARPRPRQAPVVTSPPPAPPTTALPEQPSAAPPAPAVPTPAPVPAPGPAAPAVQAPALPVPATTAVTTLTVPTVSPPTVSVPTVTAPTPTQVVAPALPLTVSVPTLTTTAPALP